MIQSDKFMKTFSLWRFLLLSSVFLLVSGVGLAQFVFEASMRPRAEYRYGYNELAQSDKKPVFTISQRTRLGGFFSSDRVTLKITLQDVRVWGDETLVTSSGVFGDAASIDLAEAWMKFEVTERFSVTLGRQTLSYDDERLLSKRNWNQYGVFYDAVLLQYSTVKTSVNFGASYNNATEMLFLKPYNPKKMKLLGFVHLEKEFHDWLSVSVVSIFTGFTPNDTSLNVYGKLSSGVILEYNKQPWYFMSGFYYQFGKDVSTGNCLVANAYNLNFLGRYKHRYITLELGLSLLSGDKLGDLDKGKTHLFDLLYGARHRYYGYLDYFSNLAVSTGRGGPSSVTSLLLIHVFPLSFDSATKRPRIFLLVPVASTISVPRSANDAKKSGPCFSLSITDFCFPPMGGNSLAL